MSHRSHFSSPSPASFNEDFFGENSSPTEMLDEKSEGTATPKLHMDDFNTLRSPQSSLNITLPRRSYYDMEESGQFIHDPCSPDISRYWSTSLNSTVLDVEPLQSPEQQTRSLGQTPLLQHTQIAPQVSQFTSVSPRHSTITLSTIPQRDSSSSPTKPPTVASKTTTLSPAFSPLSLNPVPPPYSLASSVVAPVSTINKSSTSDVVVGGGGGVTPSTSPVTSFPGSSHSPSPSPTPSCGPSPVSSAASSPSPSPLRGSVVMAQQQQQQQQLVSPSHAPPNKTLFPSFQSPPSSQPTTLSPSKNHPSNSLGTLPTTLSPTPLPTVAPSLSVAPTMTIPNVAGLSPQLTAQFLQAMLASQANSPTGGGSSNGSAFNFDTSSSNLSSFLGSTSSTPATASIFQQQPVMTMPVMPMPVMPMNIPPPVSPTSSLIPQLLNLMLQQQQQQQQQRRQLHQQQLEMVLNLIMHQPQLLQNPQIMQLVASLAPPPLSMPFSPSSTGGILKPQQQQPPSPGSATNIQVLINCAAQAMASTNGNGNGGDTSSTPSSINSFGHFNHPSTVSHNSNSFVSPPPPSYASVFGAESKTPSSSSYIGSTFVPMQMSANNSPPILIEQQQQQQQKMQKPLTPSSGGSGSGSGGGVTRPTSTPVRFYQSSNLVVPGSTPLMSPSSTSVVSPSSTASTPLSTSSSSSTSSSVSFSRSAPNSPSLTPSAGFFSFPSSSGSAATTTSSTSNASEFDMLRAGMFTHPFSPLQLNITPTSSTTAFSFAGFVPTPTSSSTLTAPPLTPSSSASSTPHTSHPSSMHSSAASSPASSPAGSPRPHGVMVEGSGGGGGGGGASPSPPPKPLCEECLQALKDNPVGPLMDGKSKANGKPGRKKPIALSQRERTRALYEQYLVAFADQSDERKANYIYTHFTLCGTFKRLRQLVGCHNKQHVKREDAEKITRNLDSKLDVIRECVIDGTVPLLHFINAKKSGRSRAATGGDCSGAIRHGSVASSQRPAPY